ncbi:DUF3089 domain-containing protein [Hyphobacterium sp.]|uniref:DUF3089 domain-containing protein n=1 Tax=Hyphobacterium sp. TaxID=2004662 RepID=UPI003BA91CFF
MLLALASWVLRDQIYQSFLDPGEPYQTYIPPEAPDYRQSSAWYVLPESPDARPALFFIHGTTYSGGSHWNTPLDAEQPSLDAIEIQIPNFAAPFGDAAQIFAPRYRQAALYVFSNLREDGVAARQTASEDVQLAFQDFLERIGEDRPFIISGVGQGGLHASILIAEVIARDEALRRRMVTAYVQESPLPLDLFEGPLSEIPPCETPEDFRCVHSFVSALSDNDDRIRILTERSLVWSPDGGFSLIDGRRVLCVNPILGARTTDYAPARLHLGGAQASGFREGAAPAALPAQTGAQCTDGVLMIEEPRSRSLHRPGRLMENYQLPPFNLFYEDLRADIARRTQAFMPVFEAENQMAPPLQAPEDVEDAPITPIPDRAGGG